MRRVVVTGMGLVSPLGCGVGVNWERLIAGQSGIRAIQSFDVSDLPAKIAAQVPPGETADGGFNADDWVAPKDQRRMDTFIIYALAATEEAVRDADWKPEGEEDRIRTGVLIGSGIGGLPEIANGAVLLERGQVRRLSPVLHPRRPDQSRERTHLDQVWLQGPQPFRSDRVRHRRARDRRCRAHDHVGRRRRNGCRRHGSRDLPSRHRRFRAAPRAIDQVQRHSGESFAPLGQGPGRLRHGRGRRGPRSRGDGAREEAGRHDLRRGRGLWDVRRRPPSRLRRDRRRRLPLHADGVPPRRHESRRDRLYQRAWHLDATRRRDRTRRGKAAVRRTSMAADAAPPPLYANPADTIWAAVTVTWSLDSL